MAPIKRLLRSTPFRLALTFTSVSLLCFTLGALVYNLNLRNSVLHRIDHNLIQKINAIEQTYYDNGIESVVDFVEIHNTGWQDRIGYSITTIKDRILVAGNVSINFMEEGWSELNTDEANLDANEKYRFLTRRIDNMMVSVGSSKHILHVVTEQSLLNFLVTFAITALTTLVGGILLAYRTQSRVHSAAIAMNEVADGNFDIRLPVSDRGDDIDNLSSDMNGALALLQQQINAMKQVSENISHDLKTPLNRLFIKIEEATTQAQRGLPVENLLQEAGDEAAGINSTFEALLRIAQIEARARRAKFTTISVVPLLEKVVEAYDAVAEEEGQTVQVNNDNLSCADNTALDILGDKELLLQLVVNLVENAIRHCPPGTAITLDAGVENERVWISVSDTGPGIPAEANKKVFERLYQLDTSRTDRGSGLGLSMVKAIVDLHCADIELKNNRPGLGVHISFEPNQNDS